MVVNIENPEEHQENVDILHVAVENSLNLKTINRNRKQPT